MAWLGSWAVVLAAAPPAGSAWRWSVERSASATATATVDGQKRRYTTQPDAADRTTLMVKVLEAGEAAPKRVEVTVTSGAPALEGRRWIAEDEYGEARLTVPPGAGPTELQKGLEQMDRRAVPDLRRLLGHLFKPDPFVRATADGPPCAPSTLERVAAATGDAVRSFLDTSDVTFEKASARCVGKGRRYAVATTARVLRGSGVQLYPFTGTVDVPSAGWLSTVELSAPFRNQPDGSRVALESSGTLRLRSSMQKK
jgi:hypothetical protein